MATIRTVPSTSGTSLPATSSPRLSIPQQTVIDGWRIDQHHFNIYDNTSKKLTAQQIKAIREREHVSQTVFATYLNVTPNLVSKWERGEKRPSGPALKLLSLVEKHGIAAVA